MLEKKELIQTIEAIYNEKGLKHEDVISAVEAGIESAAKSQYGNVNLKAKIFHKTHQIFLYHVLQVVEQDAEDKTQISHKSAQLKAPDVQIGDLILEELPLRIEGRVAANTARSIILKRIKELEAKKDYEKYKDKEGAILEGKVVSISSKGVNVSVGDESLIHIPRSELLFKDNVSLDQRIKFCITLPKDPEAKYILGSRASTQFLRALFDEIVPEIKEGTVDIKAIARDPGRYAKIAVSSKDPNMKPVGLCIGIGGARVKNIRREVKNEKLDIIEWVDDKREFIKAAFAPVLVRKVVLNPEKNAADIYLDNNHFKNNTLKGKDYRLISNFVGVYVNVVNEAADVPSSKDYNSIEELMDILEINDIIAMLLDSCGYNSISIIAKSESEQITQATGMDMELVNEIIRRAKLSLEEIKLED